MKSEDKWLFAGAALLGGIALLEGRRKAHAAEAPRRPPPGVRLPVDGLGEVRRIQDKSDPAPGDIVTVRGYQGEQVQLQRCAATRYQAMLAAARRDGIQAPLLELTSGYRSAAYQKTLFDRALARYGSYAEARKWVAPPGTSSHQSGRAIDLKMSTRYSNDSSNVSALRSEPAYRWMERNGARFGFAPYSREPWHYELHESECRAAGQGGGTMNLALAAGAAYLAFKAGVI